VFTKLHGRGRNILLADWKESVCMRGNLSGEHPSPCSPEDEEAAQSGSYHIKGFSM